MREIFNLNFHWRFREGDDAPVNYNSTHQERFDAPQWMKCGNMGLSYVDFPDEDWEEVQLPHDFILRRGDFREQHNVVNGSLGTAVGWYRRVFPLSEKDREGCIHLEFDGIFRDSELWVNGHLISRELSGYSSNSYDITEYCHYDEDNAIAVKCRALEPELWSYEGGGIYRNVRLVKTSTCHVPAWGTFVRAEKQGEETRLLVTTEIDNSSYEDQEIELISCILSPLGEEVGTLRKRLNMPSWERVESDQSIMVEDPELWSPESPRLYTLVSEIQQGDRLLDRYETPFGIRFIRFDAKKGFFLNGESLKLKGLCCHQDHGGVGAGVPDALQDWRVNRLKEMGANSYRASHNPASPALLDSCDRLGLMVMDENRILGVSPLYEDQLENLIRRGRNHPSIILWSLGNEEMKEQHTPVGISLMRKMQEKVHRLDPTRPVTYAMNCDWISIVDEHEKAGFELDVFGSNYTCGCRDDVYDEFHEKYPNRCLIGSETGGSASTRGLYETEESYLPMKLSPGNIKVLNWSNPKRQGIVSAYGETFTAWGRSIMDTWRDCADRPYLAGTFLWTGFDYRGEVFPYQYPSVVTRYGIMDLCGFPKDAYYYYKAWWSSEPVLHLFPHWDWLGRDGEEIEVWCYSNLSRVELFLNGASLGDQNMERNGHLVWKVPYSSGELKAIAYDEQGNLALENFVSTTGEACRLEAQYDRRTMLADGEDVVAVNVSVRDKQGNIKPRAESQVFFTLEGPGRILGVGNGNPVSHEPDVSDRRRCYHGWCQVLIQSSGESGTILLKGKASGLEGFNLSIKLSGDGTLKPYPGATFKRSLKQLKRSNVDEGL